LESKINRITDILRRDDGISGAMHYTEQISWVLFLKFLADLEESKSEDAELDGETYTYILDEKYRWQNWAVLKVDGKKDIINSKSGDDLLDFVNKELFPYLKGFKSITENPKSIKYKIGAIFEFLDNRIANGHTLREVLDIIDEMDFHNQSDLFQLSLIYEKLLKDMGSDGGNSGEFYTPRPLIKVITDVINPQIGQSIYDPAVGSCGFLIEAYNHIRYTDVQANKQRDLSTDQLSFLNEDTFFGNEKTPLSYVMGVMNMILHGVESPNISKSNTLTKDIRGLEEKDRFDCILANPPFGGKEKEQIQQNFPIKSNATELLFLQHMMNHLKLGGKCGVVIPEGVLFQTNNAFQSVKKDLLERFNVHTILSLPSGVFLPYSAVKTNVVFFDRAGSTNDIYYYEVNPPFKLTKNKPINNEHFAEFLDSWQDRKITENSWIVNINDIKDFDISAKNPKKNDAIEHKSPIELVENIKLNNAEINDLMDEIETILIGKDIE
jgi:type I restriction enzyme M protein